MGKPRSRWGLGRRQGAACVALAAVAVTGCADYRQLSYRTDTRIRITAPVPHAMVTAPLSIAWEVVKPTGATAYALFIDRPPIRPGRPLADVAHGDTTCGQTPGCPGTQYFNDRGVYITEGTTVNVDNVQPLTNNQDVQIHDAILVLLDQQGRRIGESAWHVPFRMKKRKFG